MTDAVALSMPTNARAGNAGGAPAGRMGADAAGQDQDSGGLSGFEAMFASIASGEPLADGDCAVALGLRSVTNGNTAGAASAGSGIDPSSTAKKPMMPGGVASNAALALMRLNEVAMPAMGDELAETVTEGLETADGDGEALSADIDVAEADTAALDQQTPEPALPPWSVPVMPQPATTPAPVTTFGNPPAEGSCSGAEAVASELLAQLDTAPELPSAGAPPPKNDNAAIASTPYGSSASAVSSATPAMVDTSAGQAAITPTVKAVLPRNTRSGEQATDNDTDASFSDAPASGQPQATPPYRAPFTASNPAGQGIGQASPASQSAAPAAPAAATDEDAAQSVASNLTSRAHVANGEDFELPREPAALISARIAAVHQETYFAPTVQQSPVEQIAERLTEELAAPSGQAAAASSDQAQDGAAQAVKVLHLQLNPPDLGPLTVRMTLKHEALDLQVEASKQETAKLIDNDREKLFGLLRAAGYTIDAVTVQTVTRADASAMNSGSSSFPESHGQASAGGQQPQERGAGGRSWQDEARVGEAFGGNGRDGLDIGSSRTVGGGVYL